MAIPYKPKIANYWIGSKLLKGFNNLLQNGFFSLAISSDLPPTFCSFPKWILWIHFASASHRRPFVWFNQCERSSKFGFWPESYATQKFALKTHLVTVKKIESETSGFLFSKLRTYELTIPRDEIQTRRRAKFLGFTTLTKAK